ncbi:unnamed protein product [Fusarium equiseti]|uniref:F-box domain-containing protein n=1 Tax=Fusarium equiseti TaxID=61235 RepID=A0A8J2IP59_FUSEQ|nr:unnamed protein product [Fusarium equiseti]
MPSLVTLPTELIVEIADCLSRPPDLKSFSSTNRRLRHVTSSILFRALNIACPLVSDMLLEHMLSKYRHVISRIHLHIRLRPNLPEDDTTEIPSIWGTGRSDTLIQLVRREIFSHINTFSVRFDPSQFDLEGCWFGDGGTWGGGESISVFRHMEDDGLELIFETMHIWRTQYNQVFVDLSMNPNITKLRLVDLLPKRASIWYSGEWKSMLQRLTHFDQVLSVSSGLMSDTGQESFPLHAPASALHSLELKNIVLGIEVICYLREQAGTLRELTIHNCMCHTSEESPEAEWSEIWGTVSEYSKVLRRLTFIQDKKPTLDSYEYTRTSRIAKRMVKKNKDLIVWRYVKIDERRGTVHEDGDANVQEVKTGHAYRKYCDLQKTLMERREQSP